MFICMGHNARINVHPQGGPGLTQGILTKKLFSVRYNLFFTPSLNIFNVKPPQIPSDYDRILSEPPGCPGGAPGDAHWYMHNLWGCNTQPTFLCWLWYTLSNMNATAAAVTLSAPEFLMILNDMQIRQPTFLWNVPQCLLQ